MAKILLVEDDNNLREIYEARLQAEGYTITSARDGEEALVVAKAEHPDLVISDVMMPKISGFEMLDIMRNTDGLQHVKVIMLTALGQSEDQKRADSLGADRYLVKSQVTLEDIVNVSQQLLQEAGAIAAPAPEPAAEPPIPPVTPMPTPAPEPPAPVVEEPVAAPAPPVIPLAAAPSVDMPPTGAVQMPPTAASTIPAVPAEPVTAPEPPAPVVEEPAPAPEPAAEPAPEPPTPPVTPMPEPTPAPEPVTNQPQTVAEESATVEQQIETFVASQSGEAPSQVEPDAQAAAAVQPETTQPETGPNPEEVVAQAAQSLSGETQPSGEQPAGAPEAVEASAEPASHKKVIKPLGDTGTEKKSLDELLAEEAAKANGAPAATAPPSPASPPANPNDFDPNSIAL